MYAGFKRIAPEQDTGMVDGARVRFSIKYAPQSWRRFFLGHNLR